MGGAVRLARTLLGRELFPTRPGGSTVPSLRAAFLTGLGAVRSETEPHMVEVMEQAHDFNVDSVPIPSPLL